jgi:hypothetical protein
MSIAPWRDLSSARQSSVPVTGGLLNYTVLGLDAEGDGIIRQRQADIDTLLLAMLVAAEPAIYRERSPRPAAAAT